MMQPKWQALQSRFGTSTFDMSVEKKPEKGREAAAPSNIKEIQEIQGGQEAPLDGDAINPKDA